MSSGRLFAWRAFWLYMGFPVLITLFLVSLANEWSITPILGWTIVGLPFALILYACWKT